MTLVIVKRRAELSSEKCFFFLRLSRETEINHDQSQKSAVFTNDQRSAKHREKDSGVNRMPDVRVRTGADQLMVLFDLHFGAPVFPNRGSSPDGEDCTGQRQRPTHPTDPLIRRNKAVVQKIQDRRRKIVEQKKANNHERDVGEPGSDRFRFRRFFRP